MKKRKLYEQEKACIVPGMSTFTAIIEPPPDGTLHLPPSAEWRHLSIRVKAELESGPCWMAPDFNEPGFQIPSRTAWHKRRARS
ncbi:MAG: hypothetical protein V4726_11785, partial [Verrucomicrobiota bacterium]